MGCHEALRVLLRRCFCALAGSGPAADVNVPHIASAMPNPITLRNNGAVSGKISSSSIRLGRYYDVPAKSLNLKMIFWNALRGIAL